MKMTFTKSQFEMPDGKYLAKFLGVTLREDKPGEKPRLGSDGKPLPPAMTWDFEIIDGEQAGKKADKLTGRVPTAKSGCGKMLAAISDSILKDGMEIDLDQLVGKIYRITVEDNRVSDNPAPVRVYDHQSAPPPPSGGVPRPPAPPRPPAAAKSEPADDSRWRVYTDDEADPWKPMTAREFRQYLHDKQLVTARVYVCPEGTDDSKPSCDWGFTDIPF